MKLSINTKSYILTIFCLIVVCTAYSQQKAENQKYRENTKIEHSVLSSCEKIPSDVKSSNQIILNFKDVNTFLYTIKFREVQRDMISDEETANNILEYSFKPSDISFLPLKLTDFQLPEIENHEFAVKINDFDQKLTSLQVEAKKLNNEKTKLSEKLNNMVEHQLNAYKLQMFDSITTKKELLLQQKIHEINESEEVKKYKTSIDSLADDIQQKLVEIEKNRKEKEVYVANNNSAEVNTILFRNLLQNYLDILSTMNENLTVYDELMFVLYSTEPFNRIESQKKQILKDHFGTDCEPSHILHSYHELFNKLDTVYYAIQKRYDIISDKKQVANSFSKISDYHNKLDKVKYQDIFRLILKIYNAIDSSNWKITYQTTNISDKADKIFYSLELTPIRNEYTLTNKIIKFNYELDIDGGYKIDVSAGFLYHFMLTDDEYRFEKETEETTRIVKVTQNYQFTPSAAALFNIYKRSSAHYKLALNFGGGTNIEKIYYYLGAGFLMGKSERIGVSTGLVGGTVNRISNEYKNKEIIDIPIEKLTKEVLMQAKDPFKIGYYFGITYNLSGKNKGQMEAMLRK